MAAPFRPNPVPPTYIHSSRPISEEEALEALTKFLDRAATDPALQPNAIITQDGPKSRTTADAPNLTLHNLKRIQKALQGQVLGRDLSDITAAAAAAATKPAKSRGANTANTDENADKNEGQWEDKEAWELEQTDALSDSAGKLNNTIGKEIAVDENGMPLSGVDKEERKRAKKAKRKAEKAERAENARKKNKRGNREDDLEGNGEE